MFYVENCRSCVIFFLAYFVHYIMLYPSLVVDTYKDQQQWCTVCVTKATVTFVSPNILTL